MAGRKDLDEARQRAAMEAGGPPAPWPEPPAPVPPPETAARQGAQAGGSEPSPRPVPFPEPTPVGPTTAPAAWTAPVPPPGAGPAPWPSTAPSGVPPAEVPGSMGIPIDRPDRPAPFPEAPAPVGQAAPVAWPQPAAPSATPAPWPAPGQSSPSANGFPQTQLPGPANATPAGAGDVLREFRDLMRDARQFLDEMKRREPMGGAGGTTPAQGQTDPFATRYAGHPTVPQITEPTINVWRQPR